MISRTRLNYRRKPKVCYDYTLRMFDMISINKKQPLKLDYQRFIIRNVIVFKAVVTMIKFIFLVAVSQSAMALALMTDPGFESELEIISLQPSSTATSVEIDQLNPLVGNRSARITINSWGARASFVKTFSWTEPTYSSSLLLSGKIKFDHIPAGTQVEIAPVVYYRDNGERVKNSVLLDHSSSGVIDLAQVIELDINRPLDRVYYWIQLHGSGPVDFLMDEVQLSIAVPNHTDAPNDSIGGSTQVTQRSIQLDDRNNLEADGVASNDFKQQLDIQLFPSNEVVGQGVQTVSFGLPLPPGVLVNTNDVVVLNESNQEIPAFVRSLGAWHNMPHQSLLCGQYKSGGNPGIRSVLIQFQSGFSTNDIQHFHIRLNHSRQLNVESEVDIQSTLRQVNDGTYLQHGLDYPILEPKILAVIAPDYLSCTNLIPLMGKAGMSSDMVAADKAQQDFFYTAINVFFDWQVNADQKINFLSDTASYWLYDRSQTFFNGYLRSGNIDNLREGLRATEHYKHNIYTVEDCADVAVNYDCVGFFKLKNKAVGSSWKDSKYAYNENLITAYLLTGNESYLNTIILPTQAVIKSVDFDSVTDTERHRANALLTTVLDYELTNDQEILPYITNALEQLYQRQQLALEDTVVNGCFNYAPEGGDIKSFSPWMSSLLSNALLRAYQAVGDERIPGMLVQLAQCEVDRALYVTAAFSNDGYPDLVVPYYIAQSYGVKKDLDGENPWNAIEHALDVALPVALGAYFTTDLKQQSELIDITRKLLHTHHYSIQYWTRYTEGRPVYRLAPPRKYQWQYKNVGAVSWILDRLRVFAIKSYLTGLQ